MHKLKAGFVGFIRPDDPEFAAKMKKLADLGYKGYEGMGMLYRNKGEDAVKAVKDMGWEAMCASAQIADLHAGDYKKSFETAKAIGAKYVVIYSCSVIKTGNGDEVPYDVFMKDVEVMDKVGAEAEKEGLELLFHNHHPDMAYRYGCAAPIDIMLKKAEHIQVQLDIGWCHIGGVDPVAFMEKWSDRIRMLHVKDYLNSQAPAYGQKYFFAFTTPGTGVVNIKAALKKACELGIEFGSVEMDNRNQLDDMLSLQTAYCNMKEYGCVV